MEVSILFFKKRLMRADTQPPCQRVAAQGVDVEVRLTTQNVRLHQVTVWEFFEPEIDQ